VSKSFVASLSEDVGRLLPQVTALELVRVFVKFGQHRPSPFDYASVTRSRPV